jgi:hypothetical protein
LLLEDETAARSALCELARITKPGGTIWVGEVSEVDEYVDQTMRQESLVRWLGWRWNKAGKRAFAESLGQLARAALSHKPFVIVRQSHFYSGPENFLEMAVSCGMECKEYFRSKGLNPERGVIESKCRYDYIFSKRAGPPNGVGEPG